MSSAREQMSQLFCSGECRELSENEERFVSLMEKEDAEFEIGTIWSAMSHMVNSWSTSYISIVNRLRQSKVGWVNAVEAAYSWLSWYADTDYYDDRNESSLMMAKKLKREGFLCHKDSGRFEVFGVLFRNEHRTLIQKEAQLFFLILDNVDEKLHSSYYEDWWRCPFI